MDKQMDGEEMRETIRCHSAERKLPELKLCPFCGTEPCAHEFTDGAGFAVWCVNEGCAVRPFTHIRDSREQAIADWNGRA